MALRKGTADKANMNVGKPEDTKAAETTQAQPAAAPAAPTQEQAPAAPAAPAQPAAPTQEQAPAAPAAPAQPAAPTQEQAPAPDANQQMAPASQGGAVTTHGQSRSMSMSAPDDGFDALDDSVGFGSFPIVKLTDTFEKEGNDLGTEFQGVIMGVQQKFLFREAGVEDTQNLFYSYDGETALDGRPVRDILGEWAANGMKHERKKYLEVLAVMQDTGEMVILSIPPASQNRLGGYRIALQMQRQRKLNQVVTKFVRGGKLTAGNNKSFYPWNFEYVQDVEG